MILPSRTVLDAWSKSRYRDRPQRAEAILERMAQLHNSGALDTKPDRISYSSMITCWSKSGRKEAPDAALKVLRTMIHQYRAGDKSLRPDTIMFERVIMVFMQAGQVNRAKELHDEMRTWK
jgi:hypothetical protein